MVVGWVFHTTPMFDRANAQHHNLVSNSERSDVGETMGEIVMK
jgi:hypothetical protein